MANKRNLRLWRATPVVLFGMLITLGTLKHPGMFLSVSQVPPREGVVSQRDEEKPRYLLIYTTWRKCYECPNRTLAYCPHDPDCNVPMKGVTHIEWFDSPAEAIDRMNGNPQEVGLTFTTGGVDSFLALSESIAEDNLLGLFKVFPLSPHKVKVGEYEAEEKVTVKVKRDKKEWRLREE